MKRKYGFFVFLSGFLVGALVIIMCLFGFLFTPAKMEEQTISNDQFTIKTRIHEINDMDFVTFHIEDTAGNVVFSCKDNWRCWDFKEIRFLDDSNDVYVHSGDIGIVVYKFEPNMYNDMLDDSGNWIKVAQ